MMPANNIRLAAMLDQQTLDREFPQDPSLIYLNHAAVAPWPARTARAVREFAEENARIGARESRRWTEREQQLREQCRQLINAPSADDIALLKNTSEAISVVACGLDWQSGDNVVIASEEFPSNRIPWLAQARHGVELREVATGVEDPESALLSACDGRTRILAVSSVHYASGLRLDLARLGRTCRERGILFCIDAIQSLGAHPVDVTAIHADCVMADAHKWLLGPEGIALFYCTPELRERLALYQFGWHMLRSAGDYGSPDCTPAASARRFECGSANNLGVHALSASLSLLADAGLDSIERMILKNINYLIEKLDEIDDTTILTRRQPGRLAGILTFAVEAMPAAELHRHLLARNVMCAARGGGIRLSPHFYTRQEQLDRAVEIIAAALG